MYYFENLEDCDAFNRLVHQMTDAVMDCNPHLNRAAIAATSKNHLRRAFHRMISSDGVAAVTAENVQNAFLSASKSMWRGLVTCEKKHPGHFQRKYVIEVRS